MNYAKFSFLLITASVFAANSWSHETVRLQFGMGNKGTDDHGLHVPERLGTLRARVRAFVLLLTRVLLLGHIRCSSAYILRCFLLFLAP